MTLRAKQAISTSKQRFELKPGAIIGVGDHKGTVQSLTQVGDHWKLIVIPDGDFEDPDNFFDADGNGPIRGTTLVNGSIMIYNFQSKSKPAYYLATTVDAWATRDIPITLDHIVVR